MVGMGMGGDWYYGGGGDSNGDGDVDGRWRMETHKYDDVRAVTCENCGL